MSGLSRHRSRGLSLALAAMGIVALAFNGSVAAGGTAASSTEPAAVVSADDVAPMVDPVEDVSEPSGDAAPMVEPMQDVDE